MVIPALSIRQPWAWLIVNGQKDIENRDWPTGFRGRMLVHAGLTLSRPDYEDVSTCLLMRDLHPAGMPAFPDLKGYCGGIVGSVEVVDCVTESESPWFMGRYGFVLRDPRPLPFVPWKGRLGFFNVPAGAVPGF